MLTRMNERIMLAVRRIEDVSALVRERRRALGWTQSDLAKRIGTRQAWVSALENGKYTLQVGLVFRALHELGVTLLFDAGVAHDSKRRGKRPNFSINDIVDG